MLFYFFEYDLEGQLLSTRKELHNNMRAILVKSQLLKTLSNKLLKPLLELFLLFFTLENFQETLNRMCPLRVSTHSKEFLFILTKFPYKIFQLRLFQFVEQLLAEIVSVEVTQGFETVLSYFFSCLG